MARKKDTRQRLHAWLWAPTSASHTCTTFSLFLLSYLQFSAAVVQQEYVRIEDDLFPEASCRVFCVSLFSLFLAVYRRVSHCSGSSLFPGTSEWCAQGHLALSSKNTFSGMQYVRQCLGQNMSPYSTPFIRSSSKTIFSQETNKELGPRHAVGVSCFRSVKEYVVNIKAAYGVHHSFPLVSDITSSVVLL